MPIRSSRANREATKALTVGSVARSRTEKCLPRDGELPSLLEALEVRLEKGEPGGHRQRPGKRRTWPVRRSVGLLSAEVRLASDSS